MDVLLFTVAGTIIGTVVATAVVSEGAPLLSRLSIRIVRQVLDRLPDQLPSEDRERWREEIEADAATYAKRPLASLGFALNLRRKGARRLAAELLLRAALVPEPQPQQNGDRPPPADRAGAAETDRWRTNGYAAELKRVYGLDQISDSALQEKFRNYVVHRTSEMGFSESGPKQREGGGEA